MLRSFIDCRPRLSTRYLKIPKLLFALLVLFSSVSAQSVSTAEETQAETDLVHFGDLIDVDIVGSFEYDWRGTMNPEGFLDGMDRLEDPVFALCRTESDIAADLTKAFSRFLRNPQIVVKIIDRSRRAEAIVGGAVRTPYRFQIRRAVRLNELIVLSGGITDRSNGEIMIFRPESLSCAGRSPRPVDSSEAYVKTSRSTGSQSMRILISDLLKGDPEANPQIRSGDIVTVSEAAPIYIIGGVNNPRQISSRSQTTLSRAVASAGGLAKDALADKIIIYRRLNGQPKLINADLSKIHSKKAEDVTLEPYDIVDIAQKGREKRRFAPRIDGDPSRTESFALRLRIVD